jgi:predicted alpha/beta-fold hydrolase
VLVVPGLGGCADAPPSRRLALALRRAGFATLRLNLRGAGRGRVLAGGSYAARCDGDLLPVLEEARRLARSLRDETGATAPVPPLAAVGVSLGGTILLNACQAWHESALAALVCVGSPLDLGRCSEALDRPRNALYQRWLVRRLRRETLADRRGLSEAERRQLSGPGRPRTIRAFDACITVPRWGHASLADYHAAASPLPGLRQQARTGLGPSTLLLQAADDPWVPAASALELAALVEARAAGEAPGPLQVLVTRHGGHCGFHGLGDDPRACWSDRLAAAWLQRQLQAG